MTTKDTTVCPDCKYHYDTPNHEIGCVGRYAKGGPTPGPSPTITIERVGNCPNDHTWFRLGGGAHVEHVARRDDWSPLQCPYSVVYQPKETA